MMPTSAIACCMTALAVERMGNKPIRKGELINFIKEEFIFKMFILKIFINL